MSIKFLRISEKNIDILRNIEYHTNKFLET
nr:MAG TPA: hypothetical protein [Caudoviricetes sp.]